MEPVTKLNFGPDRPPFLLVLILVILCLMFVFQFKWYAEKDARREESNRMTQKISQLKIQLSSSQQSVAIQLEKRIRQLQPRIDPILSKEITNAILENSKKLNLSPWLVVHLIFRESSFNPFLTSCKDARGLMQVRTSAHPEKIKDLKPGEIYHIKSNIDIGCLILREYLDSAKTLKGALLKYVGGNHQGYLHDIFRMMAEWEVIRETNVTN